MAHSSKHLFDRSAQQSGDTEVECLGMKFPNDDARRAYFTEKLREKLKDPAFRKIEGFPIGDDEAILALSDPPYYTACPNPFFEDTIEHASAPTELGVGAEEAVPTEGSDNLDRVFEPRG